MSHLLFPSQSEDEQIYLVVREHPVRLALRILVWFFLAAALALFKAYGARFFPPLFDDNVMPITQLAEHVYTLFLTLALFIIWVIYYLNIQVITDRRIVDIDQIGLFSHVISELHIDKIEDVSSETNGILGTIFDYGNVYVQTAGTKEHFEFNYVPNPAQIEKMILDLYEKNSSFTQEAREEGGH